MARQTPPPSHFSALRGCCPLCRGCRLVAASCPGHPGHRARSRAGGWEQNGSRVGTLACTRRPQARCRSLPLFPAAVLPAASLTFPLPRISALTPPLPGGRACCSARPLRPRAHAALAHSAPLLTPSLTLAHHNSETSRVDEARPGEQGTQGGGVTRVCGEQRQRLASESVCAG